MTNAIIDRTGRKFTTVQVRNRDSCDQRRRGRCQKFPAVTENHQHVNAPPSQYFGDALGDRPKSGNDSARFGVG